MKGKKTGGRQKGTPNKATVIGKALIHDLVTDYFGGDKFAEDLEVLAPRDRAYLMERLLNYDMPKQQSQSVDLSTSSATPIEEKLVELAQNSKSK